MYYRKIGDYIYGDMDDYELEDNLTGSFIPHPNSRHIGCTPRITTMSNWEEACKTVPYLTYSRYKEERTFWPYGDDILMPEAPYWAYKFVDVYRHSGIAYKEHVEGFRDWDWSTAELLWTLDDIAQENILREVNEIKKKNHKRKKADILEDLVDETFKRDLMWLDLANNGECLTEEEFLENMGQTFEEWYEEVQGEPYTE